MLPSAPRTELTTPFPLPPGFLADLREGLLTVKVGTASSGIGATGTLIEFIDPLIDEIEPSTGPMSSKTPM